VEIEKSESAEEQNDWLRGKETREREEKGRRETE
jgi:hypothetical protein